MKYEDKPQIQQTGSFKSVVPDKVNIDNGVITDNSKELTKIVNEDNKLVPVTKWGITVNELKSPSVCFGIINSKFL